MPRSILGGLDSRQKVKSMSEIITPKNEKNKNSGKYQKNRVLVLNDQVAPRLSPALAAEIGLNESIIFLQIEFLISIADNIRDGRRWTYQSLSEWKEKYFIFWSESTIDRALKSLEKQGLILVADNYNKKKYDRTKWYSINFEAVSKLNSVDVLGYETSRPKMEQAVPSWDDLPQNETGFRQNETGFRQNGTTIPENTTENTTKIKTDISQNPFAAPVGGGNRNLALVAENGFEEPTGDGLMRLASDLGGGFIAVEGRERKASKELKQMIASGVFTEQDVRECAAWMRDQKMFEGQAGYGGFARSLLSVQKKMSVFLQLRSEGNLNRNKFETREERNERIEQERDHDAIADEAIELSNAIKAQLRRKR